MSFKELGSERQREENAQPWGVQLWDGDCVGQCKGHREVSLALKTPQEAPFSCQVEIVQGSPLVNLFLLSLA